MKDECGGQPITEYVGLRSKMYSIKVGETSIRKAKGVKKNIVKDYLHHELYLDTLFEKRKFHHTMNVLRSRKHRIFGEELNKVSLYGYDSKRYICEDGIHTLAYGNIEISY